MGCSSTENTASEKNIQIITAKFKHWSQPPIGNTDVPERGTDLAIVVKNWQEDFAPEYIIYNKRKSISASIKDTNDGNPVVSGKIIRASSKLPETSETVNESDRLVYIDGEGVQHFIEIKNWESRKD